jgi:hypothetical protein
MNKIQLKPILPHLAAIAIFFVLTIVYFHPAFEGKVLPQHDNIMAQGMSKELVDYNKVTGKDALWTNSMFSGMPAYQIRMGKSYNIYLHIERFLQFGLPGGSAAILLLYMLCFYFFFSTLGFKPWMSVAGALAFAFCSYNLIIIMAGHITKAYAMAFVPPVLAGFLLTYKGKYIAGGLVTMFALGVQIACNHIQITYYLAMMIAIYVICRAIYDFKQKNIKQFLIASAILVGAVIFAIIPNVSNLMMTAEYGKYSTRSKSDLTSNQDDKTKGLDKSYILNDYSYGVDESLNLLIPNFKGGSSSGALSEESETFKLLQENHYPGVREVIKQMPTYWGDQRYTAGPVYIGAIVIFLFVLGIFVVNGPIKWWLISSFVLSLFLAWGRNFLSFSNFFIDYFPAYDKFRTVSMILVIASYAAVILGIFGLKELMESKEDAKAKRKKLLYAFYITGGICLLFSLFSGLAGSFSSPNDSGMPAQLVDTLRVDRQSLLRSDALRSLIFIVLAGATIWFTLANKLKQQYMWIIVSALILFDGWNVAQRYLNADNFVPASRFEKQISPSAADLEIMKDTTYYRVYNLTSDPFNEANTSYFHKSIGGYHGAKLKRYQELIERHIGKNNMAVISMLNTKYFIIPDQKSRTEVVQQNPYAMGNAWFVDTLTLVETPDDEIAALDNFNPATHAFANKKFASVAAQIQTVSDTLKTGEIHLTSYAPDKLTYESKNTRAQLAVFSEIYYPKGWNAYLDGKPVEHIQANYVLRAMPIPAGDHKIEFRFEPATYAKAQSLASSGSFIALILLVGGILWIFKFQKKEEAPKEE